MPSRRRQRSRRRQSLRPASPARRRVTPEATPAQRPAAATTAGLPGVESAASPTAPLRRVASSGTVIVGVLAAAAVVAVLAVAWPSTGNDRARSRHGSVRCPVAPAPAPLVAPPAAAPDARPPTPPAPQASAVEAPAKTAAPRPPATRSRPTGTRVLEARVCQSLSTEGAEWRCVAPSNPANPGRLSFYTRVAASADVRVRHRLVPRRPPRAGCRAHGTSESERRLSHLTAVRPSMRRAEANGASKSELRTERFCAKSDSSFDDPRVRRVSSRDSKRPLLHERDGPRGPDPDAEGVGSRGHGRASRADQPAQSADQRHRGQARRREVPGPGRCGR